MIQTSRKKDSLAPMLLAVEQLITFDRAVMVYKIFNKLCPENLRNKHHLWSHYSRFCRNIQISKFNLEHTKKRFSYSALNAWNEIAFKHEGTSHAFSFQKTTEKVFDELAMNQTRPPGRTAYGLF